MKHIDNRTCAKCEHECKQPDGIRIYSCELLISIKGKAKKGRRKK